jgi:hypothetical protein
MLTRSIFLAVTFLLSTVGTFAFTSCTQPLLNCASAYGHYAAEYTLIEGDPTSVCGQLPGDVLGMTTYFQTGGKNGTPDYGNADVAIRPESLGKRIDYAETREVFGAEEADEVFYQANALGSFTAGFPNDEAFCMVDDFEVAEVSLPDIAAVADDPETPDMDETQPAQAAIDVRYEWSNARFLVSADAQGTQFEADLEYTQDGCTATYHVVGVYPAVECKTDDECNDDKNTLNPDFALRCNTDLGLCVLDDDLPAYE